MSFMQSRYGVTLASAVQNGVDSYPARGWQTYPIDASCHGTYCSFSIMNRMYSLAAFGYLEYLKIIIGKTRLSTARLPLMPTGNAPCWISLVISISLGSVEVFAA